MLAIVEMPPALLGNDFWKGGSVPPLDAGFYFSQLGPELNPEQVLDRLALLRS